MAVVQIDTSTDDLEDFISGDPAQRYDLREFELLFPRPAWWADAACVGRPPEWFFPERGRNNDRAREVCAACPVRDTCLAWALEQGAELQGMFGGTTKPERLALLSPKGEVA